MRQRSLAGKSVQRVTGRKTGSHENSLRGDKPWGNRYTYREEEEEKKQRGKDTKNIRHMASKKNHVVGGERSSRREGGGRNQKGELGRKKVKKREKDIRGAHLRIFKVGS